jgi:hypothetical protein
MPGCLFIAARRAVNVVSCAPDVERGRCPNLLLLSCFVFAPDDILAMACWSVPELLRLCSRRNAAVTRLVISNRCCESMEHQSALRVSRKISRRPWRKMFMLSISASEPLWATRMRVARFGIMTSEPTGTAGRPIDKVMASHMHQLAICIR